MQEDNVKIVNIKKLCVDCQTRVIIEMDAQKKKFVSAEMTTEEARKLLCKKCQELC